MKRPDQIKKVAMPQGDRVPPGQFLTTKWPVLSYGPTPKLSPAKWTLRVWGEVARERQLTWEEFMALPQATLAADFHCVTQWSRLDVEWVGVRMAGLLPLLGVKPTAKALMVHCQGGYTTNVPLADLAAENVLLAHQADGAPLPPDHGGPVRLVVPALYGWKSAKWVTGLEFLAEDRPGFWELRGYHMRGDPWKEERFWSDLGGA